MIDPKVILDNPRLFIQSCKSRNISDDQISNWILSAWNLKSGIEGSQWASRMKKLAQKQVDIAVNQLHEVPNFVKNDVPGFNDTKIDWEVYKPVLDLIK